MKRFLDLLNAHAHLVVVAAICLSFTFESFAQEAGEEPPAPSEEPIVEEDDDIVIPDAEEVVEEDDDIVIPDAEEVVEEEVVEEEVVEEVEVEVVEEPKLTDAEIAALAAEQASLMEQAMGQAALDSAIAAADAGRWREAANEYLNANKYLPNNPAIIAGLQKAYSMIDNGPGLDKFQQRQAMERQAARALFDSSMAAGHDKLQQEDFIGARRSVEAAITRLDSDDRSLFSETEYKKRRGQATTLLNQISEDKEAWQHHRDQLAANEKNRDQADRAAIESDKRQKIINENLRRVRQLQAEQKYAEALDVVNEILFIEDDNPAALVLKDALQSTQLYKRYAEANRLREFGYSELAVESKEGLVPPRENRYGPGERSLNGMITYPSDWEDLTNRRFGSVDGFRDSVENRRIRVALEQTTGAGFEFLDEPLEDVFRTFSDLSGIPFYVDWPALSDAGIDQSTPVTIHIGDVPMVVVFERVLGQLSDAEIITYDIQDGILEISTKTALDERVTLEVYNITDLLFEIRDFDNAPTMGASGGGGLCSNDLYKLDVRNANFFLFLTQKI